MANNEILSFRQTALEKANIKYNDYTRSLIAELERLELITPAESARVRASIMDALGEIINIWTDGESSSIMTDTAHTLMLSLLFNIDAYLIGLNDIERAVDELLTNSAMELYFGGQRRLKLHLCEATGLLVKVKHTRLHLPNVYYNRTIEHSLIMSLKKYDIRFGAHLSNSDIDYPLAINSNSLRGIHFIRGYLLSLVAENSFCREYSPDEVAYLYKTFCDNHRYPYSEPRVNIYLLVFVNALFCDYLRKEPGSLMLSEDECDICEELLGSLDEEDRKNLICNTASKMLGGNQAYNVKTASKIVGEINNAIKNRKLKNYVVCEL